MLLPIMLLLQTKPTPLSIAAQVEVLKKIKPGMTQAQVRAVLPKGLEISAPVFVPPVDGRLMGNVIGFGGTMSGTISFLRARQIDILKNGSEVLPRDYQASDPIHSVQLIIKRWPKYFKNTSYAALQEVIKVAGKPTKAPTFMGEWANDFGGWAAEWKLNGKPLSFYEMQGDQYEARLEFVLGTPLYD